MSPLANSHDEIIYWFVLRPTTQQGVKIINRPDILAFSQHVQANVSPEIRN
jgi:hypothetical protein